MNSKAFRGFIVLSAILPVLNGCGWLNSKEPTTDEERIARLVEMDHGAIPVAYFFRNLTRQPTRSLPTVVLSLIWAPINPGSISTFSIPDSKTPYG